MTKPELQSLLETIAETLDLATRHFPKKLADDLIQILKGLPDSEDVQALMKIVTNARDVFTTKQSAELSAFLRNLEEKNFLLKLILKRINRANR